MTTFNHRKTAHGHDKLFVKTNQNVEIEFLFEFENADCSHIYVDGYEFAAHEEFLYGLFVGLGEEVISLLELTRRANAAWPEIVREIEQE